MVDFLMCYSSRSQVVLKSFGSYMLPYIGALHNIIAVFLNRIIIKSLLVQASQFLLSEAAYVVDCFTARFPNRKVVVDKSVMSFGMFPFPSFFFRDFRMLAILEVILSSSWKTFLFPQKGHCSFIHSTWLIHYLVASQQIQFFLDVDKCLLIFFVTA